MIDVFIALGSNLNQPAAQLLQARHALAQFLEERSASSLYRSAPVGYLEQPDFLNAVIHYGCDLSAEALLQRLHDLERAAGRIRTFANAPRPLDLDLILYGDAVIDTPTLTVPHPRMKERHFVMRPLAEIAPQRIPPQEALPVAALAEALPPLETYFYPEWHRFSEHG